MRRVTEGAPEPLGVTLDDAGANVAVCSAHAERIELCLFDAAGVEEITRVNLPFRSGDVFHAHVTGVVEGARYGFRAYGPHAPERGHRFDAAKLLVDPYALAIDRPFAVHDALFTLHADTAAIAPKAIATRPARADIASRPRHAWRDTIIYEAHVRGFTKRHPDIPEALRGTFAGLAHPASVAHLKRLGVTTLEIMPCAAWVDERRLAAQGLSNYWGYNPIAMMAPDPRLAPGGWEELRKTVAALHEQGIEVIVDVVFNHTGEGDDSGPTLSLRGLDNALYYRLCADDESRYVNDAGCGNNLDFERASVVRYALDALRAFARYGGVDGFRFDLATTLARRTTGFDPQAPFLAALLQDPELRELKLIAEPWDIGLGGYRLGQFPAPFGEWNDRFRDAARRFWRGAAVGVGELATRVSGSSDFFAARRRPSRSVNYIAAHDGFTLRDLVSFERKHNEANGEDNRDGTNENYSWNNGVEGDSDEEAVTAARARDMRALLATLLFSRGTPMLAMGAELGATQRGNNNAYAQDNEISWLDWDARDTDLIRFVARLVSLRKTHRALREDCFLTGAPMDETLLPDVEWLRADGAPMTAQDWADATAPALIASFYAPPEQDQPADRALLILCRSHATARVTLPPPREGFCWRALLDTSTQEAGGVVEAAADVAPRSVLLLGEAPAPQPRRDAAIAPPLLARLAEAAGIATQWRDVDGAEHAVPQATILALLEALGLPAQTQRQGRDSLARLAQEDRRALPAHVLSYESEEVALRFSAPPPRALRALLENGETIALAPRGVAPTGWSGVDGRRCEGFLATAPPLPLGRHLVALENGETCRLTIAPRRCFPPLEGRAFGLSAQLYALRRAGDQGAGDFTTLAEASRLAGQAGAAVLALNPLHALFAQDRGRASPYYPSDRRFLDPLYLDVSRLGDFLSQEEASEAAQLRAARSVDYRAVHALKTRAVARAFARFDALPEDSAPARDFAAFIAQGGAALFDFACFEAIAERQGGDWRKWPQPLRDRAPLALQAFAQDNAARLRFHQFQQFLCARELAEAAQAAAQAGVTFCRDLAVGAAPDGAEGWSRAGEVLAGFSIGAPPDAFSREGQVWGVPPQNPLRWRADGGAGFAELLGENMRHAGALRIDHVMGLARLFVVPQGAKAAEGAYLTYPLDALLGQLALESHRAGCFVVGEDLGTLPWGFRERLDAAGVLSYRVLWFERAGEGFLPPAEYAHNAMACVSTHDLPTLAGWWAGADIDEKAALGLLTPEAAQAERAARGRDKAALVEALGREGLGAFDAGGGFDDALAAALHAYVARSPARLAVAQLDDLAGETMAVNLPGTDRERPNWRRKLAPALPELFAGARARAILRALRRNLV